MYQYHPLEIAKRDMKPDSSFEKPGYLERLSKIAEEPNYSDPWGLRHFNLSPDIVLRKSRRTNNSNVNK